MFLVKNPKKNAIYIHKYNIPVINRIMGGKGSKPEADEIKPTLMSISKQSNIYSFDKNKEAFSNIYDNHHKNVFVVIILLICFLIFITLTYSKSFICYVKSIQKTLNRVE